MNHEDAIKRLRALRDEAATLPPSTGSAEFNSSEPRTRSALTRALGEKHYITQRFIKTKWTPSAYARGDTIAFTSTFRGTVPEAQGILDAAIAEIELLAEEGAGSTAPPIVTARRNAPPRQTNPGTVTTPLTSVVARKWAKHNTTKRRYPKFGCGVWPPGLRGKTHRRWPVEVLCSAC